MSRPRRNSEQPDTPSTSWSTRAKAVVSALLLLHLTAVIAAPLGFATQVRPPTPSPALLPLLRFFQPYIDAAFLNHGYAFFAPNPPAASSILRYRVEREGKDPVEGFLPDIETHRPRLFYHRHFMLSEQLSARYVPPTPPPDADEMQIDQWGEQRLPFRKAWRSFENHLLKKHDGVAVHMEFFDHRPPGLGEFLNGTPLNAKHLYRPREEPSETAAAGAVSPKVTPAVDAKMPPANAGQGRAAKKGAKP